MRKQMIQLFMWPYQTHFRHDVARAAEKALRELGVQVEPKAFLVGVRRPNMDDPNSICVDPEDGELSLEPFSNLLKEVEETIATHPDRNMMYGDEPRMREKPERIRRDSVRRAVQKIFDGLDKDNATVSFCGPGIPVGNFYVVPILQLPMAILEMYPRIQTGEPSRPYSSLVDAVISEVLSEAATELQLSDPGRYFGQRMRSSGEIVNRAANLFMRGPGLFLKDPNHYYYDLCERFNLVSSLFYEGTKSVGKLLLVGPNKNSVEVILEFVTPIPLGQSRWVRKILQMASDDVALISDCEKILGLGRLRVSDDSEWRDVFEIEFLDHYHWQVRKDGRVIFVSHYGKPSLPQSGVPVALLRDNYERLFPNASREAVDRFMSLVETALSQEHGSMFVVAPDAAEEASRLSQQGTAIKPQQMSPELYGNVSGIDGTILLDSEGICHAVGVILDGAANDQCTPSRGSRYNSGVRYVSASSAKRLAVVVSDDHTIDFMPALRRRMSLSEIEGNIAALENANPDNYYRPQKWLDTHRFYLNGNQCERVNEALAKIEKQPTDAHIRYFANPFSPDPEMDETFLIK